VLQSRPLTPSLRISVAADADVPAGEPQGGDRRWAEQRALDEIGIVLYALLLSYGSIAVPVRARAGVHRGAGLELPRSSERRFCQSVQILAERSQGVQIDQSLGDILPPIEQSGHG
jgi:hypothetical protein